MGKGNRQSGSVTSGQGLALRVGPVGPSREAGLGSSGGQDWARSSGFNRLVDRVRTSPHGGPSAERARFPSIIILRHEAEDGRCPRFEWMPPLQFTVEGRLKSAARPAGADDTDMYILLRLAP